MTVVVCGVEELPRGSIMTVMNGDTPVVVARTGAGEYHAVRGWCAHQGAMLGGGRLTWLTCEDARGGYALSRAGEILRCPWHSFEYDVTTGRCVTDPKLRLRTYPVRVEDGNVLLDVPDAT
ncbi:MAG: Rieske (2Fe-2S) protein [Thermoleophilaceae bacterium]|jgi:nitrite reductase/ring-hydroxylating ferredoxin subunit|nr:Rieske (2Fe-2S) protein [Thermoleophilaceae bacterium]